MKIYIISTIKFLFGFLYYIIFIITRHWFKANILTTMKYRALYFISFFSKKACITVKDEIIKNNVMRLKKKGTVNIAFVTYTGSMWTVDTLYNKINNNPKFNVDIIIAKFQMPSKAAMEETFQNTKKFFSSTRGYEIVSTEDLDFNIDKYDILFYCTPFEFYDTLVNVRNIKFQTLICYSCYSYMLAEKLDKLDLPMYILAWKLFCDSKYYKKLIENKSRVYTNNAIYCGFSKMDAFYQSYEINSCNKKLIIFAPHHSLTRDRLKFSTFDMNYQFVLELVDKYKEQTYWIYKPHPLLKAQSIKAGLFRDDLAYDEYLAKWKSRENAEVVDNGNYIELFKQSDAMITDSVSFIAEYQFTGNPLLLLESGEQQYNEFGEKIKNILYCCDGADKKEIELFVENVIKGNDVSYLVRKEFFRTELDYYSENGMLAAEYMYEELSNIL